MKIALAACLCLMATGPTMAQDVAPIVVSEKTSDGAYLGIGGRGVLGMNEDGCLVVDDQSLIIWTAGTQALRTEDGRVQVTDGASGKTVYVGDTIGFGGGSGVGPYPNERLAEPIPDACAELPYTLGAFLQTEDEVRQQESRTPIPSAAAGTNIEAWTDDNRHELVRLLRDRFGNRILDMSFMSEPHPHLVVRLAGDDAGDDTVPSGLHEFGAYRVDVRFEVGVGGGVWERLPEAAGSAGD